MLNKLHLDAHIRRTETNKKRKSLLIKIRMILKSLTNSQFISLAKENLHSNHYRLLQDIIELDDTIYNLETNYENRLISPGKYKSQLKKLNYLNKVYRNTITRILTHNEPDGYTPYILEWLVLNNFWCKEIA